MYVPLGGRRKSRVCHILALSGAFAFSSFYHGFTRRYIYWTAFNLVMLLCEMLYFEYILKQDRVIKMASYELTNFFKSRILFNLLFKIDHRLVYEEKKHRSLHDVGCVADGILYGSISLFNGCENIRGHYRAVQI